MNEDAKHETKRLKEEAKHEAERLTEAAKRDAKRIEQHFTKDPELQQEWIRQDNLIYGGLMGIGIVMVQPFLTADALDTSATICVVAFAVAIPLLAALLVVNRHETFRRRKTPSRLVGVARASAQTAAFTGLVAGFWHIHWIAGVGLLVSAMVAVGVHSSGVVRLESGGDPTPQETGEAKEAEEAGEAKEPGDTKS